MGSELIVLYFKLNKHKIIQRIHLLFSFLCILLFFVEAHMHV